MKLLFLQKISESFRNLVKGMIEALPGQLQKALEKFNYALVAKELTLSSSPSCHILQHIRHLFLNLMPLSLLLTILKTQLMKG